MIVIDSVVEAAQSLPPDQGGRLLLGVTDYIGRCLEAGTVEGVEPPFPGDVVLGAFFVGMKFSIDKSLKSQINGSKGGGEKARRARAQADGEPEADDKPAPSDPEADSKPSGSESEATEEPTASEPLPKIKGKGKDTASDEASTPKPPYAAIVGYLNERCGTRYRHQAEKTRRLIDDRFRDGFTEADFRAVIDGRAAAWLGDADMAQYLRPETLFGTKFEGYLNAPAKGGGKRVDLGKWSKPEGSAF